MIIVSMKQEYQFSRKLRRHASRSLFLQVALLLACSSSSFLSHANASLLPSWFQPADSDTANQDSQKEDADGSSSSTIPSELVDPIVNRELEVSVLAHAWPTTVHSVVCEAWAHWNNDWLFLDALAEMIEGNPQVIHDEEYDMAKQLALRASLSKISASSFSITSALRQLRLLKYALAMRAYSPQCELHRGLARQALRKTNQLASFPAGRNAFGLVVPSGTVLLEDTALQQWLATRTVTTEEETTTTTKSLNETSWADFLLPGETPHPESQKNSDDLIILYANLASPSFATFYLALVKAKVPFVVRHLGHVQFEEEQAVSSLQSSSSPTVLQGYGVRLDIRNVEYKAFDDHGQEGADASRLNVSSLDQVAPHFLAGVNLTAILPQDDAVPLDDALAWQQVLWQLHESQQLQSQRIPPTWQRRQLSMQAASVIAAAAAASSATHDPLMTLTDLSQNLPSVVATLVQMRIPPAITKAAQALEQVLRKHTSAGTSLYINGLLVSMDRPAWNVFELLSTIKKEQASLQEIQTKLRPWLDLNALRDVQDAWMQGEGFYEKKGAAPVMDDDDEDDGMGGGGGASAAARIFRIDVGHGWKQAVIYLNDVEKDSQYSQWPRSMRQMLMAMQYGMPPMVRRNLFTILAVVDPAQTTDYANHGLSLSQQLMQSSFPVRLGVLFINQDDVQTCRKWLQENDDSTQPCPVPPLVSDAKASLEDLKRVKVTTQAIHRLLSYISLQNTQNTQITQAYVEYLLPTIQSKLSELSSAPSGGDDAAAATAAVATTGEPFLSLYDLVEMHASLLEGMEVASHDEARDDAFHALTETVDENSSSAPLYGRALRFAAEKGLTPDMSFINGRPLPLSSDEAGRDGVGQIFMEEQNHIFRMVATNEITDTRPRSVYGKLLSGPKVFSRMHPLLAGEAGDSSNIYVEIPHTMSPASLLANTDATSSNDLQIAEAVFVAEAYLQVDTPAGLQAASNFVAVMSKYPTTLKETRGSIPIVVAYRIVPATTSSHPLCAIFAHARNLGATTFKALIDAAIQQPDYGTIDVLVDQVPDLDATVKSQILALASEECSAAVVGDDWTAPAENFIVANGRFYSLDNAPSLQKDDVDLLLSLDVARTKAVTKLVKVHMESSNEKYSDAIARVATFLALEQAGQSKRSNLVAAAQDAWKTDGEEQNPLMFTWNTDENVDELVVTVSAFVDPVTESAQRLAPLLSVIRDELQLPLTLILSPKSVPDSDDKIPVTSYYRFVADPSASPDAKPPKAQFSNLPTNHVLTLRMDVPEPWNVQQTAGVQDTDNLLCDVKSGCGDDARLGVSQDVPIHLRRHLTRVEYGLDSLMFFGQCYEVSGSPPNGLQLTLTQKDIPLGSTATEQEVVIDADGSANVVSSPPLVEGDSHYSDTLVMKNVGYWQLRSNPGVWNLNIAKNSKGAEIFDMVDGSIRRGQIVVAKGDGAENSSQKTLVMKDFVSRGELLLVQRRPGFEKASLFYDDPADKALASSEPEVINVFSLATGHLYERFLKIMMLSVTKRTSTKVKFWLFENFLSPTFKASARFMAKQIGCEVEFVTYKWPEWLRGQSEKQRIIWGYKILFLDVLFPLDVKKIIYVDADQVVRGDLKELWDMDLKGAPYGYTPFCTSRESTLGFQFWQSGFWKNHLRGKPYHISALYVVDLETFRRTLVGDQLRAIYQQLSADPNSLSNLDQDLPNYAQHQVPIFSLPQEWLWCESWCSDETKSLAKTIDLCNNPLHKEPKVSMAKRVISGPLFNESWVDLDAVVERYDQEYRASSLLSSTTTS